MEFNEYELHVLTRRRLEEWRTMAAQRAILATLASQHAGPTLRARLGRTLIRLGRVIEGQDTGRPEQSLAGAR